MALFGSRSGSDGTRSGQPHGRKSKRRWTPDPGAAQAKSWRDAAASRAEHGSPPPPTRVERPVPPRSAPPRAGFPDGRMPNADEAPTAATPMGHRPPPPRGDRKSVV